MGLFSWIQQKVAFTASRYLLSSLRIMEGYGTLGAKARPFDPWQAMWAFHSWCYAAAMLNANAVASVPLRLYTRKPAGVKACHEFKTRAEWKAAAAEGTALLYETRPVDTPTQKYLIGRGSHRPAPSVARKAVAFGADVEEVTEPHPILDILQTVNPWQNGHELTVLRQLDLQIAGNHYMHVVSQVDETPAELWRMPPQYTEVIPDKTGETFIKGYAYGADYTKRKPFPADEVIQFKAPNPRDLFYGMGETEAAWRALGLHDAKREMDLAKFENMARPDWLINIVGGTREQLETLKESIKAKHEGPKNAGKFMATTGDVKATALQWDVPEVGTAEKVVEEIAACFAVPIAMLKTSDPNRSSSETARIGWYRNSIKPRCVKDEEKLNEQYVSRFPDAARIFVAYDHVCFEDEGAQAKKLVGYVAGGILTPNDARSEIGWPPKEGADKLFPPSGGGASATGGDAMPNQNDSRDGGRGDGQIAA